MRGLTLTSHGGIEELRYRTDLAVPELSSSTDVRIRIHAAALNRLDLWVLGGIPNVHLHDSFVVGSDGSGVVESVGDAVSDIKVGDRVIINPGISDSACSCEYCRAGDHPLCLRYQILGEHRAGTFAEYVVVPSRSVRAIPDSVPFAAAAAFPLATLTAWRMLHGKARIAAGDEILIWGIGGGVALAALQIALAAGATTWVTSGSSAKLAKALEMGAHHALNHHELEVGKEIRARTGKRGVDVVIDSVGEATWDQSLIALGRRGRLVSCGGTTGPRVGIDLRRMFWNQWTIMGSTMGNDEEFDAICKELGAGRLVPPVDSVWPLANGRGAFERLASGEQFGKVVVEI